MISKRDFSEKVESFCQKAREREPGLVSARVETVCEEVRSCTSKIGTSDRSRWNERFEEMSRAYDACDQAGGIQSMCNPFVDKAERLTEACRRL